MFLKFIFALTFFTILFPHPNLSSIPSLEQTVSRDAYVHSLASLIFSLHVYKRNLNAKPYPLGTIPFSDEEIINLWNIVENGTHAYESSDIFLFQTAYQDYQQAMLDAQAGEKRKAQKLLEDAYDKLTPLWQKAVEAEICTTRREVKGSKQDPNVKHNPYISEEAKQAMAPYLLPLNHPKRHFFDYLFSKNRVTLNEIVFYEAGFRTIAKGPRSYILVARHCKLPGYLVKVYLDTELKKKYQKESWEWLVRRCEGASKIRNIIQRRNIRFFVVPDKWIYCFPAQPSPPHDIHHTRHLALILVSDMELTSSKRNYDAWLHDIKEEHLDELYEILTRAGGSSYRPDNIAYTKKHQFAFIDTEYPTRAPDFLSIRPYLSANMRAYWDKLVTTGGANKL